MTRSAHRLFIFCLAMLLLAREGFSEPKSPLTVVDVIEARSPISGVALGGVSDDLFIRRSPDGRRFVVALMHGDLERNGNWVELLSGSTDSLEAAGRVETVVRLFTTSKREDGTIGFSPTHPWHNSLVWLDDNERVALQWNDGEGPTDVITVNVRTREVKALTRHVRPVIRYGITGDGRSMAFIVTPEKTTAEAVELMNKGFAVAKPDFGLLTHGYLDGRSPWDHLELFVTTPAQPAPRRVRSDGIAVHLESPGLFSPDGRYALFEGSVRNTAGGLPSSWDKYTDPGIRRLLENNRRLPEQFLLPQIGVIDLHQATLRHLFDAPNLGARIVWSPNSRTILIGPAFLPVDQADAGGLAGTAVAEVDIVSGDIWPIPIPTGANDAFSPRSWSADGTIEVANETTQLRYRKIDGQWKTVTQERARAPAKRESAEPLRLEWRQGLNTPPALYAIETATGKESMILDPDPRLRTKFTLGRVENVEWKDKKGRIWKGRLHYPVNYTPGRRYPFVIQTHGGQGSSTEFSLLGNWSVITSAWAAQPLANRNIMVLQAYENLGIRKMGIGATPQEPEICMSAYESAIDHFADSGLADRNRVGLVGFSRSSYRVLYALTHSHFPYAAATVADGVDNSYFQTFLNLQGININENPENIGAPAFGEGLKVWLKRAPGFSADKIRAPLRLEADSGGYIFGALNYWEMFSRLHYLKKPVELFIVPDSMHADHPLQMPTQKLASLGGTVDWMDFWLNGHEDPDVEKAEQYQRWRRLRVLHEEDRRVANRAERSATSMAKR